MGVKVKVRGDEIEFDPDKELHIDLDNISEHMRQQASWVAWWGALLSDKIYEQKLVERKAEGKMAERELAIRSALLDDPKQFGLDPKVKITEAVVTACLVQDDDYNNAYKRILNQKRQVGIIKAMCKGTEDNTMILTTLAGRHRAEIEASLRSTVKKTKDSIAKEVD